MKPYTLIYDTFFGGVYKKLLTLPTFPLLFLWEYSDSKNTHTTFKMNKIAVLYSYLKITPQMVFTLSKKINFGKKSNIRFSNLKIHLLTPMKLWM